MLTNSERQQLAKKLQDLAAKIRDYPTEILVRDLPPELQQAIREQPVVGPITSSGLEHVYQIFNRLDFARHDLLNQAVDVDAEGHTYARKQANPVTPSTNQTKDETITRFPESTATAATSPLDFGPFDPRRKS